MSNEIEQTYSRVPDFGATMAQRIAQKNGTPSPVPTFDPYQTMLKRKEAETAPIDPASVQQWPEKDIKALEDYCKRMGIVGFNCGRMPPAVALAMLRNKVGEDYTGVPLEQRTPYSQTMQKKQLLLG